MTENKVTLSIYVDGFGNKAVALSKGLGGTRVTCVQPMSPNKDIATYELSAHELARLVEVGSAYLKEIGECDD